MTVYTCHNKLCVSIPTIVPDPSTHFVWDEFAIGICCYSPLSHCTWCILFNPPPPQPPSPPKKRKEKENNLHKNYFQFHLGIHHFHKDHNAPCLPFKFCITIVFDFSWDEGNTREKLKTIVIYYAFIYLCIFFWGGGGVGWGGGGNINKVHYGLCANGEL